MLTSAWVWSAMATHEPLVTREIFEAASTVARFRKGSRSDATLRRHPETKRTYALRSYLRCDICGRRAWGHTVRTCTYYRCSPDPKNHAHQPWYDTHPAHVVVREDELTAPLQRFFAQRVFGDGRELLLARSISEPVTDDGAAARATALTAEIANLQQRQDNLVRELESFEPSGDDDFDQAWRSGIQARFRAVLTEQRRKKDLLTDLARQSQTRPAVDLSLLDTVPQPNIDLDRLPEERQRRLYDAFHLELRYNDLTSELELRVTITGDTATELGATVQAVLGAREDEDPAPGSGDLVADPLRARGGSRTRTPFWGSRF